MEMEGVDIATYWKPALGEGRNNSRHEADACCM